jgi:hypothetical protein
MRLNSYKINKKAELSSAFLFYLYELVFSVTTATIPPREVLTVYLRLIVID